MIDILGTEGSSEYRAAQKVRRAIEEYVGEYLLDRADIKIVVSAKTYGEKRQDIDLVVIGRFTKPFALPRTAVVKNDALLLSFFMTIEVKDHPPNDIQFIGPKTFVMYKGRREDASEQAEQQKYSAKNYIERHDIKPPFIVAALLLNNCPTDALPKQATNILPGDFSPSELFDILYRAYEQRITPSHKLIQAFEQKHAAEYVKVAALFTKTLQATRLDRQKIELITSRQFNQKYATEMLGKQLLIFSGPGGTGKTVSLLQLAHFVFRERDAKTLVLTYNLALVSDIRRLTALMGMSDDIGQARLEIKTVHSFIYDILCRTGLFKRGAKSFLPRYELLKEELLTNIGAVNKTDCEYWDHIFIDEGQDWPINEREIIYRLYGTANIAVADGKSQLVRTRAHCDWTRGRTIQSRTVSLSKSLRLKHDICLFVEAVIEGFGIPDWKTEPNLSVYGGRVIVYIGDMTEDRDLFDAVIAQAVADGNCMVDLCVCLPPSMVDAAATPPDSDDEGGDDSSVAKSSQFAGRLREWGYTVWDGVDDDTRHSYPTEVTQLRVVQYDSCRGLEGWSVFNFALDELYDYKYKSFDGKDGEQVQDMFMQSRDPVDDFAKRWLAIPLTRAIDTLVVNVRDPDHWLVDSFRRAATGNRAVEILEGLKRGCQERKF